MTVNYNDLEIGIAGFGFVGQAVYSGIQPEKKECVWIYDKYKHIGDIEPLLKTKYLFLCLPTPSEADGKQNLDEYRTLLDQLKDYTGVLIFKSTLCDFTPLLDLLGGKDYLFNPEFLNQNDAEDNFRHQRMIILGGHRHITERAEFLYRTYFRLSENVSYFHCSIDEAIQIKYNHNVYHAYKALFWNYVLDTTGNHRKLFKAYSLLTGNTHEMSAVAADGYRGYGGACFPKDVSAWNAAHPHMLTQFMIAYNKLLRDNSDKKIP